MSDIYLEHYGVRGMKWGVRREDGVSRSTNRAAKRDAKEFTKAKMYYGEGAGTRRKMIKAKVESRAKKDESYKRAFDSHVNNTDLGKRASQARGQRGRTDAGNAVKKTAKGIGHIARGNNQYANMAAVVLFGAGAVAYKNGGKEYVQKQSARAYQAAKDANQVRKGRSFLKKNGF